MLAAVVVLFGNKVSYSPNLFHGNFYW